MKCILVPMTGTSADAAATQVGLMVAKKFDAQMEVLLARPSAEALLSMSSRGIDASSMRHLVEVSKESAEQEEIKAREIFQALLEKIEAECADSVTAIFDVVDGPHKEAVIERGSVYDLLVVPHPSIGGGAKVREIAEAALFHTGRPVLMATEVVPEIVGRSIMIGWNRSPQAGRAVSNAMPLLKVADKVQIFYVETGAKHGPSPGRLRHYLELHGISAELTEQMPDQRPVAEILLAQTRNAEADLLVMGAYSKSKLRERILGGVTQKIFASADIPVLMAR